VFGCKGGTGGRVRIETRGRIWDVTSPFASGCGPQIRSLRVPGSPTARSRLGITGDLLTPTIPPLLASPALMTQAPTPRSNRNSRMGYMLQFMDGITTDKPPQRAMQ
jgi:hypothetical protein